MCGKIHQLDGRIFIVRCLNVHRHKFLNGVLQRYRAVVHLFSEQDARENFRDRADLIDRLRGDWRLILSFNHGPIVEEHGL